MSTDLDPRHPIRVVAQRTGLSPATLRAWERRYQVVEPGRSAGGQRLYSDRDVERLRRLHQLTEAGRPISLVASLPDEALEELQAEDRGRWGPDCAGRQPGFRTDWFNPVQGAGSAVLS